jgi:hypothetical protein
VPTALLSVSVEPPSPFSGWREARLQRPHAPDSVQYRHAFAEVFRLAKKDELLLDLAE